jgi:hypothetical protein
MINAPISTCITFDLPALLDARTVRLVTPAYILVSKLLCRTVLKDSSPNNVPREALFISVPETLEDPNR